MSNFVEYETSLSCIRRLTQQDDSDPFEIIVKFNNNENTPIEVRTTINKARSISNQINRIYQSDPTIKKHEILIDCEEIGSNINEIFEKLINSTEEKVLIPNNKIPLFKKIRILLGETDNTTFEIQSIEEAISYLFTSFHDNSINYLSNHFSEIVTSGQFFKFSKEVAKELIDFYLENSDEFHKNRSDKDAIFAKFLESSEDREIVLHFVLGLEYEDLSGAMREYISANLSDDVVSEESGRIVRLLLSQLRSPEAATANPPRPGVVECECAGNELDGIVSHLKRGGGLSSGGGLKLRGGGSPNPLFPITNLTEYGPDRINSGYVNYFGRNDLPESAGWIEFDFGERKVNLKSYTIRSNISNSNTNFHPKSWRIAGSNDGTTWSVLNRQTNSGELNGVHKQHRFECESSGEYYRYIRYIQEDTWSNQKYCINLACIELFGSILTPQNL